jgi:3-methyladenine DNA glycosylase AlkD
MDVNEVMAQLELMGSASIKKVLLKHGIKEPFFGVKVEHLKTIQKKTKTDYELAKGLYATGNADAMYLAGLITDDSKMTKAELQNWVVAAVSNNISEYTVPWVAAGSKYGFELAMDWIDSDIEHITAAGWCTLNNLVALKPNYELNIQVLKNLLLRVEQTMAAGANRVRHVMNNYIIAVGTYVPALTEHAIATANRIGGVSVDKGETACKVPQALVYIQKSIDKGVIGKKKKTVK